MASRKTWPASVTASDISEYIDTVRHEIMPGAADPTIFVITSISGTIDPFTEEVTFHEDHTMFPASGIVGAVTEEDRIFGLNGQIVVGDVKVTYEYSSVSGILGFDIREVHLLTGAISGAYHVHGPVFDVMGHTPIFADFVLKPLNND